MGVDIPTIDQATMTTVTATTTGDAVDIDKRTSASIEVLAAGTVDGVISLEGSNSKTNYGPLTPKDGDSAGCAIANRLATLSAAGTYIIEYTDLCVRSVRVKLTRTTGTFTVRLRVQQQ